MLHRLILAGAILGLTTLGAAHSMADVARPPHQGGFMPWRGAGFGFGSLYYDYGPSGPTQPQRQTQVYDIAPAMAQAAFAAAQFDNRWTDLQVMLGRARQDFQISAEYLSAKNEFLNAQYAYDVAVDAVKSRLQTDQDYKNLIVRRTEEQLALKQTGIGTGLRNSVATEKLHYGSMASQMEAVALANDSTVQDARARLASADQTLRLKEKQFESQLYTTPEIAAARSQMEDARANKAGADGALHGALVTRADLMGWNY